MSVPFPPQMTGVIADDIQRIIGYLYDLHSYLAEGEPDAGWSTTGVVADKTLVVGDSLTDTQHFLGALVQVLLEKNILSA